MKNKKIWVKGVRRVYCNGVRIKPGKVVEVDEEVLKAIDPKYYKKLKNAPKNKMVNKVRKNK